MEFFKLSIENGRLNARLYYVFGALFFLGHFITAQETIGFGDVDNLNHNALLHLNSPDKGFLLPRMTSAERSAIPAPADGLLVYDINQKHFFIYKAGAGGWTQLNPVEPGLIMMWHGDPGLFDNTGLGKGRMEGWAICNGQNNTINLSSRFIVGHHSGVPAYNQINKTGGKKAVQLGINHMPNHSHAPDDPGHSHAASLKNNGKHTHSYSLTNNRIASAYGKIDDGTGLGYNSLSIAQKDTLSNAELTISISNNSAGLSTGSVGNGAAHENRPPYVAMIFIQKL